MVLRSSEYFDITGVIQGKLFLFITYHATQGSLLFLVIYLLALTTLYR